MTCMLPWEEPSLSSMKLNPPLESRRVRTHPCSRTCRPAASGFRASATEILSMIGSPQRSEVRDQKSEVRGQKSIAVYTVTIHHSPLTTHLIEYFFYSASQRGAHEGTGEAQGRARTVAGRCSPA